jgi:hypothetical protein
MKNVKQLPPPKPDDDLYDGGAEGKRRSLHQIQIIKPKLYVLAGLAADTYGLSPF